MLQLENQTPFKATIAVLPDRFGIDTLYVIVKATVTLRPTLALAEEQVPRRWPTSTYGDPATSSLRVASEMHIGKAGTDVLLVGSAWAPDKRPVTRMQVGDVGCWPAEDDPGHRRSRLAGWAAVRSAAVRVDATGLGTRLRRRASERRKVLAEERNPVGCGFAGGRSAGDMQGLAVPNLEDPAAPLQQIGQVAAPACLAPIAPSWLPRRAFAGTYDERVAAEPRAVSA